MVRAQSAKQRQWLISAHTLCPILLAYIPQAFQASLLWSPCFLILNCPLSSLVNVSILKSVSLSHFASSYFKTLNHSTTSMHQDSFLQVALKLFSEAQALFFVTHPSA
ncbi:hypothetical protein B0H11DRAFT_2023139 [Mycena galericulata]|nr:hypothetical protein B0H11DRAFT_2023139 [Mycena galericulata]